MIFVACYLGNNDKYISVQIIVIIDLPTLFDLHSVGSVDADA
jgi:hypothetical protein